MRHFQFSEPCSLIFLFSNLSVVALLPFFTFLFHRNQTMLSLINSFVDKLIVQVSRLHLSVLIPSASKDAISLISSLCSWDPCKRPTAVETLQRSFFQPCSYVPPSIRLRAAASRTPHAGVEGAFGQKCSKRYSATLSKAKPASNLCSVKISTLGRGVQGKLEMDGQCCAKQPRYRLPARSNYTGLNKASDRVSDVAEKMAHMTVGARRQQQGHL
ncbi:cyclin-dependent kinase F-4-like protein isoform X3 [Cinnamomum micranthum f. kanehirae]|uniref:Cyclin-dependent kinase F-4-like protein isoform X3 n=1 Tax=Cinnamomum micranthum f. kanehirae TaxID=337451 RepID=A0A3S3NKV0_9MAGN|nr:cyclin-dependent kinase F-4-like protein isoform X3 [Cinnamomum micranthum f. kanehirae]